MKEQMLQILNEVSKGEKSPELAQTEILGLFSVSGSLFSEDKINGFADNYSQNWSEDDIHKSIALTCYRRGFKKALWLIQQ